MYVFFENVQPQYQTECNHCSNVKRERERERERERMRGQEREGGGEKSETMKGERQRERKSDYAAVKIVNNI